MGQVDPDDDTVDRWVVFHYAYDPVRRQRRNQPVAAFDDEAEFIARLDEVSDELQVRRAAGLADDRELVSGAFKEAGYTRRQREQRRRGNRLRRND